MLYIIIYLYTLYLIIYSHIYRPGAKDSWDQNNLNILIILNIISNYVVKDCLLTLNLMSLRYLILLLLPLLLGVLMRHRWLRIKRWYIYNYIIYLYNLIVCVQLYYIYYVGMYTAPNVNYMLMYSIN